MRIILSVTTFLSVAAMIPVHYNAKTDSLEHCITEGSILIALALLAIAWRPEPAK